MKKLLTILVIALVIVGAVFAAETHTLTVTGAVYGQLPRFGLKLKSVNGTTWTVQTNNSADFKDDESYSAAAVLSTNDSTATNGYMTDTYSTDPTTVHYVEAGAVNAGVFTLDRAGTIIVSAVVQNAAKVARPFTIEFYGGQFTSIYRDGKTDTAGVYNPTSIVAGIGTNSGTGFTTTLGTTSSINTDNSSWDPTNDKVSVDVLFNLAGTTAGHELATCTFTYPGDDSINPGTYNATISMSVTAN